MLWLERKPGDKRLAPEVIGAAFATGTSRASWMADPPVHLRARSGGATMDLPPGRYIVFCPVRVNDNEDDPHFAHGMLSEVTVI